MFKLAYDSSANNVWFVSFEGTLHGIDAETGVIFYRLSFNQKDADPVLFKSLYIIGEWLLLTTNKEVYKFSLRSKSLKRIDLPFENMPDDIVFLGHNAFLYFNNGDYYSYDLYKKSCGARQQSKFTDLRFTEYVSLDENKLVATTNRGLMTISLKENAISLEKTQLPFVPEKILNDAYAICKDRDNNLWVTTENDVLQVSTEGRWYKIIKENVSKDQFQWLSSVYKLFFN